MQMMRFLLMASCAVFCACQPIVNSIVEESAMSGKEDGNEVYEESLLMARDSFSLLETKVSGQDTLNLYRAYFDDGRRYCESWQLNGKPHGIATFFYYSGKPRHTILYANGLVHTLLSSVDPYGNKVDAGNLRQGNGKLILYHPYTGYKQYEIEYRHGLRHGTFKACFSDGNIGEESSFSNDTLSGAYLKYYRSGKIHSKGAFDLRSKVGFIDVYYANGNLRQHEDYRNGELYGSTEYDVNGTVTAEKKMVDGQLAATTYFYGYEGKVISKEQLVDDKRHGTCEYFYDNGNKKSREHYRNDTLQSDTIWHANGKISAISLYRCGRKHGMCKEYYPTGTLRVEQMYADGVEEGSYRSYFANGKVYNEGHFKNGKLSGDLEFYSEKGTHTHTKHYH